MGFVYLIGEENNGTKYKIGCTKKKDIAKRLKELQTGNPNKLTLIHFYNTDRPHRLELMLHNHFKPCHSLNEWFDLQQDDIDDFIALCERNQSVIDTLKDNPFF